MTEPSSKPELDELQAWLVKVGDTRPPVEPDLDAIVGRAGQRVFRRRIGTGLALLGLFVPGVALAPQLISGDEPGMAAEAGLAAECLDRVENNGAAFGLCRFQ